MRFLHPLLVTAAFLLLNNSPLTAGALIPNGDPDLALFAQNLSGVGEPPVPIFHNGALIGGMNHQVVEAFDRVPGTGSFPLTFVDLHANMFLRSTYQNADGTTGSLGTSIVGTPSFRTPSGFQFIPTVIQGVVETDGPTRYASEINAEFGTQADVSSSRTFPDPVIGRTDVGLSVEFNALEDIALATAPPFPANDRFRILTASSMFAGGTQFDANAIRYEDASGAIQLIELSDLTPRGQHLLPTAVEIGSWFELIKGAGSTWFPDSPTIRVDILNDGGLNLGLQGFLASSTNPNDDSLSVWLEWLDAPDTVAAGTNFEAEFLVTARAVPEPSSLVLMLVGGLGLSTIVIRRRLANGRENRTDAVI